MAQLNVKLSEEQPANLRRYAARRRTPVSWLIKDYVELLLAGGEPVHSPSVEPPTAREMAALAERGRALDWLREEPEIYSAEDGESL